jgi:hypothetical protein
VKNTSKRLPKIPNPSFPVPKGFLEREQEFAAWYRERTGERPRTEMLDRFSDGCLIILRIGGGAL